MDMMGMPNFDQYGQMNNEIYSDYNPKYERAMMRELRNQQIAINDMLGLPHNYNGPKENPLFNMDSALLLNLGFNQAEINILQQVVNVYGIVNSQRLINPPFLINDQVAVSRIMYAYNICMGKVQIDIDNPFSVSKHLKKLSRMSGSMSNFSCHYLTYRVFDRIPRTAVVAGLPKGSFYVLNSKLYDKTESTYEVEKIAQEWVTIKSSRKMAVTYKDRLNNSYENREWGIPNVLKVESVGSQAENKPWIIRIHKSHCRLCNRFMIVITTRRVADGAFKHLGGYTLIIPDGTILYVYAKTTDVDSYGNPKDSVTKTTNDTIILDYGFYNFEIEPKLNNAINVIASKYGVAYIKRLTGEESFKMIPEFSGMENIHNQSQQNGSNDNSNDYIDLD